jgi:predicted acyltransferase
MSDIKDSKSVSDRLLSLDVFRGATIAAMIMVNNPGSWEYVYPPLRHAEWHGWTFTDLIFPFFLFIVGVAIVFAFSKKLDSRVPKTDLYKKIIKRSLILFALGLFLNGFPYFDLSSLRIMGVLQRIAVCYFIASLIFLNSSWKGQLIWCVGLLLSYWALMEWIPVPEIGAGIYETGKNFSAFIDNLLLKGHMWSYSKTWDPEGTISTLPAISTTLFGILTGHLLKSKRTEMEKTILLFVLGNIGLLLGACWHHWLPINKSIWTSSYSLFMAGMAMVCLAFAYYLVDIKGYKKGIQPALVYGMNAITVYVLSGIVAKLLYLIKFTPNEGSEMTIKSWIYDTFYASWLGDFNASLAFAISFILVMYFLMWILYKKKIFIKI